MNFDDYQELASRTAGKRNYFEALANAAMGLAGETGEVVDALKKALFHHATPELDKAQIQDELGDMLWYLSELARLSGISLNSVATGNIDKLRRRFPEGFQYGGVREGADK